MVSLRQHRVLVVEDEFLIALELEDVLRDAGAEVIGPAMTVAEAMRLLDSEKLTLALLDVQLAQGDSLPVAHRLEAADIPFVFHTGQLDANNLLALFPRCAVVRKPAAAATLILKLAGVARG